MPLSPSRIDQTLSFTVLAAVIVGCFFVLKPFMTALVWAAILCTTTWPRRRDVSRRQLRFFRPPGREFNSALRCTLVTPQARKRSPQLRPHQIARQPDEGEQVAGERRLDQDQPGPGAVHQAHHGGGHALDIVLGETDHQIVWERGQRVHQRFPGMSASGEFEPLHHACEFGAQAGHGLGRRGKTRAGPHPGME